jgi:hypothetical protein
MPYLSAGLAIVGAVALLNLILTTAIIRRMRTYEKGRGGGTHFGGIPSGAPMPRFAGRTAAGDELSDGSLRGAPALIAFFSTDCTSCLERAPEFASHARSGALGDGRAVAVILEGAEPATALAAAVDPAIVVHEPIDRSGPLSTAFQIESFPSFFVVDEGGTIVAREINRQLELTMFGGL